VTRKKEGNVMNDYSHLWLHDTRVARATTRPRPSTRPARPRSGWHRLLRALHAGADGARPGTPPDGVVPGGDDVPGLDGAPGGGHTIGGERTDRTDAHAEPRSAARV
jgi:hypothetical protein